MSERVYVWDRVVRATHWAIAASIVVLAATGLLLGDPVEAPGSGRFLTGGIGLAHRYAAVVFTASVVARLGWLFLGSRHARLGAMVPLRAEQRRGLRETLAFYLLLRREPSAGPGHNPLAALSYLGVLGLYVAMILTGLALHAPSAGPMLDGLAVLADPIGGLQGARWLHHALTWVLFVFVAVHLYTATLTSLVEKNGEIDSIVSGFKWLHRDEARRG